MMQIYNRVWLELNNLSAAPGNSEKGETSTPPPQSLTSLRYLNLFIVFKYLNIKTTNYSKQVPKKNLNNIIFLRFKANFEYILGTIFI